MERNYVIWLAATNVYIFYPMYEIWCYDCSIYKYFLLTLFGSQLVFSVGQHLTEKNSVNKNMYGFELSRRPRYVERVFLDHDRVCARGVAIVTMGHMAWIGGGLTHWRFAKLCGAICCIITSDLLNERHQKTYIVIHAVWHWLIYSFLGNVFAMNQS